MNKNIQAHPSFFSLLNKLREEEFAKSREFDLLFKTADPPQQRRFYRMRDQKIRKMSQLLKEKKISVDVFLNGIVSDSNKIFGDTCAFGLDCKGLDDDFEGEEQQTQTKETNVISGATCVICYAAPSDVLLSCGHYKHCISCFNHSQNIYNQQMIEYQMGSIDEEPNFKCPHCNTTITAHMHVKRIFS